MAQIDSRLVFTVEQRDALREHVLRLAAQDERVVAGAVVGSLALYEGDRFSDLDLTFSVADHVPVADELDAVKLADLERGPTSCREFLLADALQFDLSMTPAAPLRANGVMSFQASSAVVLAISALRRSAGSSWTTPPGTRWLLTRQRVPGSSGPR